MMLVDVRCDVGRSDEEGGGHALFGDYGGEGQAEVSSAEDCDADGVRGRRGGFEEEGRGRDGWVSLGVGLVLLEAIGRDVWPLFV